MRERSRVGALDGGELTWPREVRDSAAVVATALDVSDDEIACLHREAARDTDTASTSTSVKRVEESLALFEGSPSRNRRRGRNRRPTNRNAPTAGQRRDRIGLPGA